MMAMMQFAIAAALDEIPQNIIWPFVMGALNNLEKYLKIFLISNVNIGAWTNPFLFIILSITPGVEKVRWYQT
jgi:hypothetical protein